MAYAYLTHDTSIFYPLPIGMDVGKSWSLLGATATAGSSTLELEEEVTWQDDAYIVVATTGLHNSMGQSEQRRIVSSSTAGGRTTLTLDVS